MTKTRGIQTLLTGALILAIPTLANAKTADEILADMDKVVNGWDDQYMLADMTIIDVDGDNKTYEFSMLQKGAKRVVRMHSGEYKGMATLIKDPSHVYVWLPDMKKKRRVAPHKMNQSFAGSDFSNADAGFASWPDSYTPTLVGETATEWHLDCAAVPDSFAPYPRAFLKITKADNQLVHYQFMDNNGRKIKLFESLNVKEWAPGILRGSLVHVTDNQTGHKTILEIREFVVNQNVPDSKFTERELEWGR